MPHRANGTTRRMSSAAQDAAGALSDTLHELPESLKKLNRQVADHASEGLDTLRFMADQCLEQGRDTMSSLERAIERRVRQQPMQALLIAFGMGAACAFLLRPRH